jgi:hypothetical protein
MHLHTKHICKNITFTAQLGEACVRSTTAMTFIMMSSKAHCCGTLVPVQYNIVDPAANLHYVIHSGQSFSLQHHHCTCPVNRSAEYIFPPRNCAQWQPPPRRAGFNTETETLTAAELHFMAEKPSTGIN